MDLDWETGHIAKTFESICKTNDLQMVTMMETLKVDTHLGIHPDTSKEYFSMGRGLGPAGGGFPQ